MTPLLIVLGLVAGLYALVLWLRHKAFHDAISNPFDFDLKD